MAFVTHGNIPILNTVPQGNGLQLEKQSTLEQVGSGSD